MEHQSTTKGFAILSAANIVVRILSFLYIPFLLMIIHDEGYGIYSVAYQVFVFIYVITNSGIPSSISKLVAEQTALNNYKDALRLFKLSRFMLIIIGLIMSLLLFAFAKPITKLMHYDRSYYAVLALVPSIFITSIASSYRGFFQGRGNMVPTAVSQVIEQLVNTVFTILLAMYFMRYGIEAACAGGAAATSLAAVFSLTILIIFYKKSFIDKQQKPLENMGSQAMHGKQLIKKILNYSIPITVCIGMQYAGNLVDLANTKARLLVAGFTDSRATELYGYLAKFQQLLNVPISLVGALTAVVLPTISAAFVLKNKEMVKSKFDFAFKIAFMLTIPSAVGLSVLSEPVYGVLKYQYGSYLMQYGSMLIIFASVQMLQVTVLQGAGRFRTATTNILLGIVVKIFVNFILIPIPVLNINGAIIGSICGYIASISLNRIAIKKYVKLKQSYLKMIYKPLLASIVMGAFAFIFGRLFGISGSYLVNLLIFIIVLIICSFIYLFTSVIIGAITKEDLTNFPSKVSKIIPKWIINRAK